MKWLVTVTTNNEILSTNGVRTSEYRSRVFLASNQENSSFFHNFNWALSKNTQGHNSQLRDYDISNWFKTLEKWFDDSHVTETRSEEQTSVAIVDDWLIVERLVIPEILSNQTLQPGQSKVHQIQEEEPFSVWSEKGQVLSGCRPVPSADVPLMATWKGNHCISYMLQKIRTSVYNTFSRSLRKQHFRVWLKQSIASTRSSALINSSSKSLVTVVLVSI